MHARNWLSSGGTSADSKSLDFGEKAPEAGAEGSTDFIDKQEVELIKLTFRLMIPSELYILCLHIIVHVQFSNSDSA